MTRNRNVAPMRALWRCSKCGRSFANRNQSLRRHWVDGHVVLGRRLDSPRFRRIDFISPRNQVHLFRLADPSEVDDEVQRWLAEDYSVGEQRILTRGSASARRPAES